MQKLPIKIIVVAVLFCAIWLWYKASPSTAPQTVLTAQAQSDNADEAVSGLLFTDTSLNDELAAKFSTAVKLIKQNDDNVAIEQLNEIIESQPFAIEPYINLASLYAKSNDIDKASEILKKAINVNENTAVLFESLQSLYAAQAALAYQRALEINTIEDKSLAVNLPVINSLRIDKPNESQLALQESNRQLELDVASTKDKLATLQNKLNSIEQEKAVLLSSNAQLKATSQEQMVLIESQSAAQTDLSSGLKVELQQSEQKNNDLKQQYAEQIAALQSESSAKIALLEAKLEQVQQTASAVSVASVVEPLSNITETSKTHIEAGIDEKANSNSVQEQKDIAIGLVQAWARSWAEQDVPAYISYYEDQYRPANGLSNKQWREQRQVRLTNKSFIEVVVGDFDVEDRGAEFVVTFSQHYKSNNVDDRIIKNLVFAKTNGDWPTAKIVAEQVVTP